MATCVVNRERRGEAGFTLVELLIVVIILGILAAIVVPQFGSSTSDAKSSSLDSTLAEMRNAIELYYHQHGAVYPGKNVAGGGACTGNGAAAAADTVAAFTQQLTLYSSLNGCTNSSKTGAFTLGPYLKKQVLPTNPIDNSAALVLNSGASLGQLTATGTDAGGWWFDNVSGKFIANIAAYYAR